MLTDNNNRKFQYYCERKRKSIKFQCPFRFPFKCGYCVYIMLYKIRSQEILVTVFGLYRKQLNVWTDCLNLKNKKKIEERKNDLKEIQTKQFASLRWLCIQSVPHFIVGLLGIMSLNYVADLQ